MVTELRPERGGFLRPLHTGIFIRDFLLGKGPGGSRRIDPQRGAPIDDIRDSYKTALLEAYANNLIALAIGRGIELTLEEAMRMIPHRLTKMRAHSFYSYFSKLKMLGWVEPTGEEEESQLGGIPGSMYRKTKKGAIVGVPQPRRYYRLTEKGKAASDLEWSDPLLTLYAYPRERRSPKPRIRHRRLKTILKARRKS